MISEQDKQDILNGEYGITRNGFKIKYLFTSGINIKNCRHLFLVYREVNGKVSQHFVIWLTEDFKFLVVDREHDLDIVGLWKDNQEPFDIDRALAGEPVKLRDGKKAYMKYIMPPEYKGSYPLRGYIIDPSSASEIESSLWTLDGISSVLIGLHHSDIISMWKELEPDSNTVTVKLPRALAEPQDEMWFVNSDGYTRSSYGKNIPEGDFKRVPYFGAEAHAKAWFAAMQNSRK